jgi:hypothetical protein
VACTDDACDEELDVVTHAPNQGAYDNGVFCAPRNKKPPPPGSRTS